MLVGLQINIRIALIVVLTVGLLSYWGDWFVVFSAWSDLRGYFSHGPVVAIAVAMLLWDRRANIEAQQGSHSWLLLAFCLGFATLWFVAWGLEIQAIRIAAAIFIILFAYSALIGPRAALTFAIPFSLLLLAVPIWRPLVPILQSIAAVVANNMLSSIGITTFIDGNFIEISAGLFEVADGCSGLGYLLVSVFLAGYLCLDSNQSAKTVCLVLLLSVLFGLVSNWVRIFLIIVIAHFYGIEHPVVAEHVWFGWFVYVLLIVPAYLLYNRFVRPKNLPSPVAQTNPNGIHAGVLLGVLCVLLAYPALTKVLDTQLVLTNNGTLFKQDFLDQQSFEIFVDQTGWEPSFINTDLQAQYRGRVDGVDLFAFEAHYQNQRNGREVISSQNKMVDPSVWKFHSTTRVDLGASTINESTYLAQSGVLCIWYWYKIGEDAASLTAEAKVKQFVQKIQGRRDGAFVATATKVPSDVNRPSCTEFRTAHAAIHGNMIRSVLGGI